MISKESYTKEWVDEVSEKLKYNDKALIEKVIRALSLLEHLVQVGCPLIFKGGTSLMLILGESLHRASIDIDVICPPGTDINHYMLDLGKHGFTKATPVAISHSRNNLPATHSKVFYEITYANSSRTEEYIKLDVLYEECPYSQTMSVPIQSPFLKLDSDPVLVKVATAEGMLGDKLTAFAPNTIGIPYFKGDKDCFVEIIKQLYDIGRLFENIEVYSDVYSTFLNVSETELGYRNLTGQIDKYYEDVRQTSLCIATRGKAGNGSFEHLQNGISRIRSFMYRQNYFIEHAIVDSARAAYLVTCFEKGKAMIEKYSGNPEEVLNLTLANTVTNKLNKLKSILPEAYFYWAKTSELLKTEV